MKNKLVTFILMIVMFLVPTFTVYSQIPIIGLLPNSSYARMIVLFVCGAILLITLIVKHKELNFDTTDKILLLFYMFGWISTIFSVKIFDSIFGANNRYEGIIMIGVYLLIYYCAKNFFIYYKHFPKIMCIFASLIAIYAILEHFGALPLHNYYNIPYNTELSSGTLLNHNFLGSFLTIFLPLAMCIYITSGKKLYLLSSGLLFVAVLCSMTRSAWVAFFVYSFIIFVFIILKKDKKVWLRSILLFIFLVAGFCSIFFTKGEALSIKLGVMANETKYIASTITNQETPEEHIINGLGSARVFIWKMAVNEIIARPLTGCGVDAFKYGLALDQPQQIYTFITSTHTSPDKAHNEFLQIGATMGLPALILYILAIATILDQNIRNTFKDNVSFIFVASIIGYLVQSFFNISVIMVAPLFWFLLGLSNNKEALEKMKKGL